MNRELIEGLNKEYEVSSRILREILGQGVLKHEDILEIVSLNNTLIASDFLTEYQFFSDSDLVALQKFIVNNMDHENRLFVSDLIEFATVNELKLPYKACIDLLDKYEDDHTYVQLAVLGYIQENLKLSYIAEFYPKMNSILNNTQCNQRVQLNAAFILLRITGDEKYLGDIVDLMVNGQGNEEMLISILDLEYNKKEYFEWAAVLEPLVSEGRVSDNAKCW